MGTGVPQDWQNREPGASRVPQSEHDGGWVTRAPHASQNAVFAGTAFLHRGQMVCFFFFTPGILNAPYNLIVMDSQCTLFYRVVKNPLGKFSCTILLYYVYSGS